MKVFVPLSGGFLHGKHPENDRFLFIKARFTAGKHICSINLNVLPELSRSTARETFYKIAATYVKVVVTEYCLEKTFYRARTMIM